MHSVESPATMSCRSQATTTARCRLRGRVHQTICLGGDRMVLLNSQSLSFSVANPIQM